jgi:hypothetical protein
MLDGHICDSSNNSPESTMQDSTEVNYFIVCNYINVAYDHGLLLGNKWWNGGCLTFRELSLGSRQ